MPDSCIKKGVKQYSVEWQPGAGRFGVRRLEEHKRMKLPYVTGLHKKWCYVRQVPRLSKTQLPKLRGMTLVFVAPSPSSAHSKHRRHLANVVGPFTDSLVADSPTLW